MQRLGWLPHSWESVDSHLAEQAHPLPVGPTLRSINDVEQEITGERPSMADFRRCNPMRWLHFHSQGTHPCL